MIVAHLGSGASLCALKNGKSVDSSLGFTALDGLCMGTRPGAVDPGVILYLFQTLRLTAREVETILYKKSGLLGISGISNDMRNLVESSEPAAKLAVDYFVYRAAKEIGALAAVLGGIDGLVFTAGIGENSPEIRRRICKASAWLGIDLDDKANAAKGPRISKAGSRVSAWLIPTNEELMIARHTGLLLGLIEDTSMTTTATHEKDDGPEDVSLEWIPARSLAEGDQRSRLHPAELRALRRRRVLPRACHSTHAENLGRAQHDVRRGEKERRPRCVSDPQLDHGSRAGLYRPRERSHRRSADRRAAEARDHAERRLPSRRQCAQGVWLQARPQRRRDLYEVPEDAQRRCVRRVYGGRQAMPQLAHSHGAARRVRTRPDHRRLSPCRALRGHPTDRTQAAGEERPRRRAIDRRDHPRSGRARRADPRAQGAAADGVGLRVRHLGPGAEREGSRSVALLRIPGRRERTERGGDVARPDLDLPRHLLRARSGVRRAHRGAGAGDHRRLRDQAAHRPVPAHAGVRRALRRRSHLGHRIDRRDG